MEAIKLGLPVLLVFVLFDSACGLMGKAQQKQENQQKQAPPSEQELPPKELPLENPEKKWLDYWPQVVEIEGTLTVRTFFGPPNFGENPRTDSKERSWILSLDEPINVKAKTDADAILGPSVEGVKDLQLVLRKPHGEFIGKKVIVKGTLFHAHTGHHHTDVLMDVQSIGLATSDN